MTIADITWTVRSFSKSQFVLASLNQLVRVLLLIFQFLVIPHTYPYDLLCTTSFTLMTMSTIIHVLQIERS